MIEWWGWLAIWTGLVIALIAMIALFAWRLVRRFFGVLEDFFTLTDKLSILDGIEGSDGERPLNAVLEESAVVRERFAQRMRHRADRKAARRQARIQRAKMITTADINLKEWPHEHG